MDLQRHPRVTLIPGVMGGKPCIKDTRLPVEHILAYLGAGDSIDDVLAAYPFLTREDVLAALAFAADYLRSDGLVPA
ncbi:MAG: hypothetical protein BroJett013_27950 [Alphaproteobacteria bacterium]|nr:MAG: hypothetical protein BroJett013_27950 [Alphaproteobacteria bacterium]